MRAVKISLSLLALLTCALSLSGCNTIENRRSLYWPKKGEGYWTKSLHDGTYRKRGTQPADTTVKRGGSHTETRTETPAPIPPPPPPLPAEGEKPPAL